MIELGCVISIFFFVLDSSHPFCEDSISYCDETLEDFPRSCVDNLDFAKHNCREACGHCQKPNTPTGNVCLQSSNLTKKFII